jgi:hypothetical protein
MNIEKFVTVRPVYPGITGRFVPRSRALYGMGQNLTQVPTGYIPPTPLTLIPAYHPGFRYYRPQTPQYAYTPEYPTVRKLGGMGTVDMGTVDTSDAAIKGAIGAGIGAVGASLLHIPYGTLLGAIAGIAYSIYQANAAPVNGGVAGCGCC